MLYEHPITGETWLVPTPERLDFLNSTPADVPVMPQPQTETDKSQALFDLSAFLSLIFTVGEALRR